MIDYSRLDQRLQLIKAIESEENQDRKSRSLKECEIYNDDIRPYVEKYLRSRFSGSTVDEMPIIASINLAQKIVNQEASIYTNAPEREFTNLSDEQSEVVKRIYDDMFADTVLLNANRFYRLQKQTHIKIFPMRGKLVMKNYKNHQIDAEPDDMMPELAQSYIFVGFNKWFQNDERNYDDADGLNQAIADEDDYRSLNTKYVVWSPDFHFTMNGHGQILSEETENPIEGVVPVIDVAMNKDFEYFNSYGNALADFCIEFNGHLSSLAHVVDLQGFSQAILSGPPELLPKNLTVGPNHIIYLPSDPSIEATTSFEFANPGSDITGSQNYIESVLSMFLSSRGVDPTTVSGSAQGDKQFSSGIERLLAMIEKFEASREDLALFEKVEQDTYKIIKAWHNALRDTDQLDDKYKTAPLPDDSEVQVKFSSPELIQTDKERLEAIELKLNLGLVSQRMAVKEYHDADDDRTKEIMDEIDGELDANNENQEQLLPRPDQETGGFEQDSEGES